MLKIVRHKDDKHTRRWTWMIWGNWLFGSKNDRNPWMNTEGTTTRWLQFAFRSARFQTTNLTFHTGEPCDPRLVSKSGGISTREEGFHGLPTPPYKTQNIQCMAYLSSNFINISLNPSVNSCFQKHRAITFLEFPVQGATKASLPTTLVSIASCRRAKHDLSALRKTIWFRRNDAKWADHRLPLTTIDHACAS